MSPYSLSMVFPNASIGFFFFSLPLFCNSTSIPHIFQKRFTYRIVCVAYVQVLQDEKRVISSRGKVDHVVNGSAKNQKTVEGGGNSAEDEGISSSEQDDCEEEVSSSKKVQKVSPYKMYSNVNGLPPRRGDDTVVEEVLEDFDKMINSASTESAGGGGGGGRKMSSASSDNSNKRTSSSTTYYEYSDSDVVIIPTRIVPEPPRRSRSLFVNKNFEVNPFFEDDEDESADSECAYEDDGGDVVGNDGKRQGKPQRNETFRSVQKQIERFSALAVRDNRGLTGRTVAEDEDFVGRVGGGIEPEGRRKSIYNVFGNKGTVDPGKPVTTAGGGNHNRGPAVIRSVSTRNVNDPGMVVPRFDLCRSERSVYLPSRDGNEPKVFRPVHNNAGLYSGFKDTDPSSPSKCKQPTGSGSNGLKALQHINMSVSTGKLTDFPSGLY